MLFRSQLPKIDGEVRVFGKVGREVTPDAGARSIGEAFTSLTGDGREGGEW